MAGSVGLRKVSQRRLMVVYETATGADKKRNGLWATECCLSPVMSSGNRLVTTVLQSSLLHVARCNRPKYKDGWLLTLHWEIIRPLYRKGASEKELRKMQLHLGGCGRASSAMIE